MAVAIAPEAAVSSREVAVQLVDVTKVFGSGAQAVLAVDGLNLEIYRGELVCLLGASGCGKSTVLNLIAGLERATRGQVVVPAASTCLMFQESALFPWLTVNGNVAMPLRLQRRRRADRDAEVQRLLELVRLEKFGGHRPHQLSGGMRQRVNLARALAIDPEILLMDEPFAALDAQTREIMQTELLRIWERGQKTVLFVTHQIDEAVFLSDRVLVFARRPGRVQAEIKIPLPRPRHLDIKRTPEFVALVDRIWRMIEDDVRAAALYENA